MFIKRLKNRPLFFSGYYKSEKMLSRYSIRYFVYLIILIISLSVTATISTYSACSVKDKAECSSCPENTSKANEVQINSNNSSAPSGDEFEDYDPAKDSAKAIQAATSSCQNTTETAGKSFPRDNWVYIALLATILSGVLIRFKLGRKMRPIILLSSIAVLGFYLGACPCPISSFSHLILWLSGANVNWQILIWFLALMPITYIFGQVWCGWVCHLGALQEFLFKKSSTFQFLNGKKAQTTMKILRIILLAVLVIQLLITQTYMFDRIDPFKTIYNLGYNSDAVALSIMVLTLLLSIFIYRPFCKSACPIGLILGLISLIPGASILKAGKDCNTCANCKRNCDYNAITADNNGIEINNQNCINCSQCLDKCRSNAIKFSRKQLKSKQSV